jgi:hypothetical protein
LTELNTAYTADIGTPLDEFMAQPPEGPRRESFRRMLDHYDRHGLPGGNPLSLRVILGREPRSVRDYFLELADGRSSAIR